MRARRTGGLGGLRARLRAVKPPYTALAARLDGFDPDELSALMASREVARLVTLRATIHTHTADDCLALRPSSRPRPTASCAPSAAGSPESTSAGSPSVGHGSRPARRAQTTASSRVCALSFRIADRR